MFYLLSKILDLAFSPLAWAMALCALALVPWKMPRLVRAARWLPAAALVLLYAFSNEPVANALSRSLEDAPPTARDDVTYDAVFLLGGILDGRATEEHGMPAYNSNVERMLSTFDLLRKNRARVAVVSAAPWSEGGVQVSEGQVVADQLAGWGIDRQRVIIEDRALNTRDNAVECAKLARQHAWTRTLLVTSAFHMTRAIECFHAVGLEPDVLPVDHRAYQGSRFKQSWLPRVSNLDASTSALRELAGRLIYRLRGYAVR